MPKADATGLAPKKSADHNPPAHDSFVREGSAPRCFYFQALHTLSSLRQVKIKPHFFGEVSERRPWAQNAKTARPPLPGAPNPTLLCSSAVGIPLVPTQVSILSHPRAPSPLSADQAGKKSEKSAGKESGTFGGEERDPLQNAYTSEHLPAMTPVMFGTKKAGRSRALWISASGVVAVV
jgi:hypothetical protein